MEFTTRKQAHDYIRNNRSQSADPSIYVLAKDSQYAKDLAAQLWTELNPAEDPTEAVESTPEAPTENHYTRTIDTLGDTAYRVSRVALATYVVAKHNLPKTPKCMTTETPLYDTLRVAPWAVTKQLAYLWVHGVMLALSFTIGVVFPWLAQQWDRKEQHAISLVVYALGTIATAIETYQAVTNAVATVKDYTTHLANYTPKTLAASLLYAS